MKLRLRFLLVTGLAMGQLLLAQGVIGATAAGDFEAANQCYEQGKFSEAAAIYKKMTESGLVSSALYFNLGNAFFKSSQLGRALAAYREAEKLSPRDPDIRANLKFARDQIQGPTLPPNRWQRWLGKLTVNEWTVLTSIPLWICLITLTVMQLRPGLKPALRNFAFTSGTAAFFIGACLGAAWLARSDKLAIVILRDTTVRSGPLDEAQTSFTAHDGAEFKVLDAKDNWLQVSADGRHEGWLRRDQVVALPKPL